MNDPLPGYSRNSCAGTAGENDGGLRRLDNIARLRAHLLRNRVFLFRHVRVRSLPRADRLGTLPDAGGGAVGGGVPGGVLQGRALPLRPARASRFQHRLFVGHGPRRRRRALNPQPCALNPQPP